MTIIALSSLIEFANGPSSKEMICSFDKSSRVTESICPESLNSIKGERERTHPRIRMDNTTMLSVRMITRVLDGVRFVLQTCSCDSVYYYTLDDKHAHGARNKRVSMESKHGC